MRRLAGAVASSYHGWEHALNTLLQEVDLVAALRERGLSQDAALAFLHSCPSLLLEASWHDAAGAVQEGGLVAGLRASVAGSWPAAT